MIIFVFLYLGFIAFLIASMWKIFEKAGEEGWKSIIPIYNIIILLKIVGKPTWWLALMIVPVVNFVFTVWMYNMLSKSFGKDEGFTVGLILLGFVFFPILGFGDAVYLGPYGNPEEFALRRRAIDESRQFDFDSTL